MLGVLIHTHTHTQRRAELTPATNQLVLQCAVPHPWQLRDTVGVDGGW